MAAHVTGIEVYVDKLFDESTPCCAHGPTLLFKRLTQGCSSGKRYYACSASRERRECSFFQWEDAKVSAKAVEAQKRENQKGKPPYTSAQYYQRKETFLCLTEDDQKYCSTCGTLLLPDDWKRHSEHDVNVIENAVEKLSTPTRLLQPLENNKTNAQYLFSEKSVGLITKTIENLGFTQVLCIGTPRIHEEFVCKQSGKCRSFLLDMDHRLGQFFPPESFCRYNMFNHHFFEGNDSKKRLSRFLSTPGKLVMVMDPPFGGLLAVLAHTLKTIQAERNEKQPGDDKELAVLFIFPYFMEKKVKEHMPGFTMLDYKVDYTNHTSFHSGRSSGGKHGSPVRIYTNLPPSQLPLPTEEGYRFCDVCAKWVSSENQHCKKCDECTSKDGRTYRHCDGCGRCVKPSYVHCDTCGFCALPDHKCGGNGQLEGGCFVCGDSSHKRKDCPNKATAKKRKQTSAEDNPKSKKRKWRKAFKQKKK